MADTKPDVQLTLDAYIDLNTAASIDVGTDMIISNKTSSFVRIQISPTQPAATSTDGEIMTASGVRSVYTSGVGESTIWALGLGPISVQQND